ncbi:hypothetical protein RBU20_24215, partial [Pseudomonas aeruginosa]|nr:hypothetical protein [Pseudomonas aeruginosa]
MSSTQHQLIEQCATRLRGIVEALDNIHDTSPHRWSTDLDDVHSSAESLLAMIKDQAPPSEDQLIAAGLSYPLAKEDAVQLWYAGFRSEVVTVLEAWEAIGHDIGMNPSKGELLDSLRNMAAICNAHGNDMPAQSAIDQRQAIADAITGALAFGAQASRPPPADHWLRPFYDIGRAEGQRTQELAMLVRMLASSLKRHAPESNLVARATNYLAAKGLAGTPLRDAPASVEQVGGDERAAFELFVRKHCGMPAHIAVNWDAKFTNDAWEGWKARAALEPSPVQAEQAEGAHVPDEVFAGVFAEWWEEEGQYCRAGGGDYERTFAFQAWRHLYPLLLQARAALAQPSPAQAEAERPEVVARVVHSNPVVLGQCGPLNANDELMTVAQHAASVARWAEMFNRVEQERDAALARVSGLRSLLNPILCYVENDIERMRGDRDKSDNKEIYDLAISLAMERLKAAQHAVFTTEPGCDTAVELASHITAQAQHSAPEVSGIGRDTGHPRAVVLYLRKEPTDDDLRAIHDALRSLAAAPGKEVPQAWLDV